MALSYLVWEMHQTLNSREGDETSLVTMNWHPQAIRALNECNSHGTLKTNSHRTFDADAAPIEPEQQ
jgi:hypothetical protein